MEIVKSNNRQVLRDSLTVLRQRLHSPGSNLVRMSENRVYLRIISKNLFHRLTTMS